MGVLLLLLVVVVVVERGVMGPLSTHQRWDRMGCCDRESQGPLKCRALFGSGPKPPPQRCLLR